MSGLALRYRGPREGIRLEPRTAAGPVAIGDTIPLPLGPIVLGRGQTVDVVVHCERIARHHTRLSWSDAGELLLEDLGGTNQTQVNGTSVPRAVLRAGDVVSLGEACDFEVVATG